MLDLAASYIWAEIGLNHVTNIPLERRLWTGQRLELIFGLK
jgi:hypothetical protein